MSADEEICHLKARDVSAAEHECRGTAFEKGAPLEHVGANSRVLGEQWPAAFANVSKPNFIGSVLLEMVVVDFDGNSRLAQGVRNDLRAERPIDEEVVRLTQPHAAPNGWRLR